MREHWSSKIGFLFAAIGSAIGLGVLWKVPYTVGQNGGGLFLLAYFLCIVLIGIPVFIGELLLGRKAQRAAVGCFALLSPEKPFWKLAGWLGLLSSFLIMSFYSVIAGWGMNYIFMSLAGFYRGLSVQEVRGVYETLASASDINLLGHFLFTLMTVLIVLSGVRKGIEHWAKIMMQGLLLMLVGLVIYSMTLPGFREALTFIFKLDFAHFKGSSIIEALGLAFFTLSLGQGIMLSYGSYMSEDENVPLMTLIVSFSVVIVAILTSLTVFPVVFSFGFEPKAGTGLVFQTLPYLFGELPGGQVLATLFFLLFVFAALTSTIAFVEVVAANTMELFGLSRKRAVLCVGASTFVFGIPSALAVSRGIFFDWQEIYGTNFLDTMDRLISIWCIPVGGLLTAIFIGWIWSREEAYEEFTRGCNRPKLFKLWRFSLRWVIPLLIFLIILQKSELIQF